MTADNRRPKNLGLIPHRMRPSIDVSGLLLERWLLAIMDISARAISLADRPQRAIWVTSVRMRREDRTSISSHPLADLGRYRVVD
jgi:hypothetical protein